MFLENFFVKSKFVKIPRQNNNFIVNIITFAVYIIIFSYGNSDRKNKRHSQKERLLARIYGTPAQYEPAAYSKIENSETKLSVDRLFKISEILETPIEAFLDINPNTIYHQTLNDNSIGHQEFQNLYQDNKEKTEKIAQLYEARLQDKNDMIVELKKTIEKLS